MITRSSIRTTWPGPPPHRHRRATTRSRWSGTRRLVLGLVALLAGILALNGVIQAAGAPPRSTGKGVDIASLLPPTDAEEKPATEVDPASPAAAEYAATTIARSSDTRPAQAAPPTPRSRPAARAVPPAAAARVPRPTTGRPAAAAPSGAAADAAGEPPAEQGSTARATEPDRSTDTTLRTGDAGSAATDLPSSRDQDSRPGRTGLLPAAGCAVGRAAERAPVRIGGRPLVGGSGC